MNLKEKIITLILLGATLIMAWMWSGPVVSALGAAIASASASHN